MPGREAAATQPRAISFSHLLRVIEDLLEHARPENWDDPDPEFAEQVDRARAAWREADRVACACYSRMFDGMSEPEAAFVDGETIFLTPEQQTFEQWDAFFRGFTPEPPPLSERVADWMQEQGYPVMCGVQERDAK